MASGIVPIPNWGLAHRKDGWGWVGDPFMKQWYVLRSKPRKEATATFLLGTSGIEVYFPQTRVVKHRDKPAVLEPLFPGYMFGRLDPLSSEVALANRTSGILHVLGYGDEPWSVPDELVQSIKDRLARSSGLKKTPMFRTGDGVIITAGPLRGIEAVFDAQLSANGRVRVLIQILKRLCRTEVHVTQLKSA
jgi:transcriptional antiterminator RfaH